MVNNMTQEAIKTTTPTRSFRQLMDENRELAIIFGILLIIAAFAAVASPNFRTEKNTFNVLRQAVALGMVSIGQTFVILSGGIDLSVGATISLIAVYTAGLMKIHPDLTLPIVLLMVVIGLVIGLFNGTLVTRLRIAPFIATLATGSIVQGFVLRYAKKPVGKIAPGWNYFAEGMIGPVPFPVILLAVLFILAVLILKRSVLGKYIVATGGNERIARYSGIRTTLVLNAAYVICTLTTVLTGLFLTSRMAIGDPQVGGLNYDRFDLDSIAAVLVGGTRLGGGKGTVVGTLAGVLIVSVLNNIFNLIGVSTFYQWIVKGIIILVAVAAYSSRKSNQK
jgi:ribose/xylose/arabinose/galactoside ABC-type transport system permease subunit